MSSGLITKIEVSDDDAYLIIEALKHSGLEDNAAAFRFEKAEERQPSNGWAAFAHRLREQAEKKIALAQEIEAL